MSSNARKLPCPNHQHPLAQGPEKGQVLGIGAWSFVLGFGRESTKCSGQGVLAGFEDLRERQIGPVFGSQAQECAAHDGEIGQGVGVAGAGLILLPAGIAAPVIADFGPEKGQALGFGVY